MDSKHREATGRTDDPPRRRIQTVGCALLHCGRKNSNGLRSWSRASVRREMRRERTSAVCDQISLHAMRAIYSTMQAMAVARGSLLAGRGLLAQLPLEYSSSAIVQYGGRRRVMGRPISVGRCSCSIALFHDSPGLTHRQRCISRPAVVCRACRLVVVVVGITPPFPPFPPPPLVFRGSGRFEMLAPTLQAGSVHGRAS
jgi:hypothetical protein